MAHTVVLVPGFLGYNHMGSNTYFADRFVAGLRVALEAKVGSPVKVVAAPTLPVGSLAARQEKLLSRLIKLELSSDVDNLHLVGHSAGGLDAALLARQVRLEGGKNKQPSVFGKTSLNLPKLRSVTTIAAPHYGTGLALSAMAKATRGDGLTWKALANGAQAGGDLFGKSFRERVGFACSMWSRGPRLRFLKQLLCADGLARDTDPETATRLTETQNRRDIKLISIATITPAPGPDCVDRLFRDLWTWTHVVPSTVPRPPPLKRAANTLVIASNPAQVPDPIGPEANDGVVNTDRQVAPNSTFAGIVLGDHADVLGHYERDDIFDGKAIDAGLLTSGAEFGDDQFFELINLVAAGIP